MINSISLKFLEKEARSFKVKIGVFLLLIQKNEVLLLRRYNTGIADGRYVVPMGGVKEGETATQALIRETEEETSIILHPEAINVCHVMYRFHQMPEGYTFPQVDLYFKAASWSRTITNCEPHKCDELQFYSLQSLPDKTEPFIIHALECAQKGIFFSEFGW